MSRELAEKIADIAGFSGQIEWDATRPDGMMRKCMDVSRIGKIGFQPKISLDAGIRKTISEYRELKREGRIR